MRYRVFVVVVGFVMLMPGVLAAQDDETWYFAWRPETGEVVAYTAEGEVNTILDGGVESSWGGLRLGPQTFIAMFESTGNGDVTLYSLTPETAQPISTSFFNANTLNNPQTRPDRFVAIANPYALVSLNDQPDGFQTGLLINVETGVTETLNLRTWLNCCRFSEDGLTLRYTAVEESGGDIIVSLRERTLATGEERIIYIIIDNEEPYPWFNPDRYGERWLYSEIIESDENRIHTVTMLHLDGTSEILAEEEYYYLGDSHEWQFLEDNLVVLSNSLCERDCSLIVYPPGEESPVRFTLPPLWIDGTIGGMTLLPKITDESLLINRGLYEYWQLKPSQDAVFIGASSTYTFDVDISEDGRWLLVTDSEDEPEEYRVWDNLNEEYVLTGDFVLDDIPVEMLSDDENVLVQSINTGAGKYYISANDMTFELSGEPRGSYFEILADGTLLFQQSNPMKIARSVSIVTTPQTILTPCSFQMLLIFG